ncbi:hypothetical protein C0Q70_03587 [Pomacea canaliculata]|uniref:Doublecortin domain-containing protein n=1 Tax=Pomacea canaliculata TaxID=400727 RepID=A0A2T7PT48_POMCA|nr:hypothetical protein C0Q70_03587 [Pomacea canaliculata]
MSSGELEAAVMLSATIVGHSQLPARTIARCDQLVIVITSAIDSRRMPVTDPMGLADVAMTTRLRPVSPQKAAAQSFSDYDRESSGTDDDVTEYGGYDGDGRYEVPQTRLPEAALFSQDRDRDRDQTKKPRRVWVYRNADENFKGKQVLITQKEYPNFETLLVKLGNIVPTVAGVRYIFSWPEGKEIKSITELQNNRFYVCSSVNRLQRVNYGNSREHFWKGGKIRHNEKHLFTKENGQLVTQSPSNQRPHVITVISNMYRDSREKLILNPNTAQNFEDVLQDLQNMVFIPHPPVRALWTEEKPHIKVEGFSHLFRELKDHKTFLVCGEEREPREPREPAKRTLPSSNSSSDSVTGKRSLRRSKQAKADTARLDSLSPIRRGPPVAKRTEPLRVEINGRQRDFFLPSMPALENDGLKPDKKLRLDWVYGFRGRDVRQNLVVLPNTGELVYFVAAIVVLYDRRTHTQKHYTAHTEEVTCLAIHPREPFIASGQLAGRDPAGSAHVRIWHGITMSTQAVIGIGVFQQGVACISFSEKDSNGNLLMTIDESDRHVMSVWDWQRETMVAKTTTTNDPVVSGCFYQFDDSILITFGKQHMYFWTVFWKRSESRILRDKKSGLFEDEIPKFVTAVCFGVNGEVITGDSTGSILVWQRDDSNIFTIDRQVSASMKEAHKKSISSLVLLSDGVLLSGGGSEIKAKPSPDMSVQLPEMYGSVRTVVPQTSNGKDGFLFIGTSKNIILEGSLQQKFRPIVQGHCEELWAVASHPSEPAFYTAGHDMSVMKWSALSHAIIWSTRDKKPCTSIAVDSRGQIVAVGTTSGKVTLYSAKNGEETQSVKVGAAQINAISFSPVFSDPSGRQIAVGTHDGFLHLLVLNGEGELYRHQSASLGQQSPAFVMHLDWSSDGRFIQTVLGNYELVFWDSQTMQKLKSGRTLRDAEWASYTVPVGYPLIGSWHHMERGEVVNVACRSYFHDFIVTGDSRGRLRLFKYPCTVAKAEFREVSPSLPTPQQLYYWQTTRIF